MLRPFPPSLDDTLAAQAAAPQGTERIGAPRGTAPLTDAGPGASPGPGMELPRVALAGDAGAAATEDLRARGTLGEGGMGRVLLAWQESLHREVAVKTTKARADAQAVSRLLTEGRLTGSLEHPGIVPVHALGASADGAPLLVMKRIDGVSLRDLLLDPGHPLHDRLPGGRGDPLSGMLWVLTQVCNAAHFAHSRGVVHLDIKPDNIMVGGFGEVYLLDWGIAARFAAPEGAGGAGDEAAGGTAAAGAAGLAAEPAQGAAAGAAAGSAVAARAPGPREIAGTPAYLAPEMASRDGGPIGPWTDVYLLGATLYELLTGRPRHEGETLEAMLASARASAPPRFPDGVPAELAALCARATAREPAARPDSALRLRQGLDDYLRHRGADELTASAEERLAELHALLRQGPDAPATRIRRVGTECRFAFELALRAWPESPAARAGKERCLAALAEDALGRRQDEEAAALLSEMAAPPPALVTRVSALAAELARERAEAEALRRQARDNDQRVGARDRVFMGLLVIALALGARALIQGLRLPTHRESTLLMAVVLALIAGAAALWRRRVLANGYSRRMVGLLLLLALAMLLHRALGWARGVPVPDVLMGDLLLSATIPAAGAVLGQRALLGGALVSLLGVGAALLSPQHLALIFPLALLGTLGTYFAVSLRQARDEGGTTKGA